MFSVEYWGTPILCDRADEALDLVALIRAALRSERRKMPAQLQNPALADDGERGVLDGETTEQSE
jgi:hypothetical protein